MKSGGRMPQATAFPFRAFFICPRARESDFGTMLVQQFQRFEETRSRTRCDLKGFGNSQQAAPRHLWMFWHCLPSSEAGIILKKKRICVQLSGNGITSRLTLFADVIIMDAEFLYAFLDSLYEVNDGVLISKTNC